MLFVWSIQKYKSGERILGPLQYGKVLDVNKRLGGASDFKVYFEYITKFIYSKYTY